MQYPRGRASYQSSIAATAMGAAKLLGFEANPRVVGIASNEAAQPVRRKLAELSGPRTIDVRQPQGELVRKITMSEVIDWASEAGVNDIFRLASAFEGGKHRNSSNAVFHLGGRYINAVTGDVELHQAYRDAAAAAAIPRVARKYAGNSTAAEVKQLACIREKSPAFVRTREISAQKAAGTYVPRSRITPAQTCHNDGRDP